MPHYIKLSTALSTNSYMRPLANTLPNGTVIYTPCQTAGRGQKGNSWESEPGKNLTYSLLLKRPRVDARHQFIISEGCSLAVLDMLSSHTGGISIKWPNDVYWHDKKICGMLIENSLNGNDIAWSILGVGININQDYFASDAPNPVSLKLITGKEHDLDELLRDVCGRTEQLCDFANATESALKNMHGRYLRHLYRNDGREHEWELPDGTRIHASIASVAPDGMLSLRHHNGTVHSYAFKQVRHVINEVTL